MIYQIIKSNQTKHYNKYQSNSNGVYPFIPEKSTSNYQFATLPHHEWYLRNAEVSRCYNAKTYTIGQIVRPREDNKFLSEGVYKVLQICKDWHEYKGAEKDETKVDWPVSGKNPHIVHAQNMKDNRIYNCTVNYFCPLSPEEVSKLNGN